VIQNVDSLAGVLLTQIANPGTPAIYGSVASNTDLRDLSYLTGSIEMGLLNAAGAQMAQFYRLPFYATAGMSDSKVIDAQCGYESALTSLLCALAGANFIHDAAGMMEFALTTSYEKYVMDNEILGMVMRAVEGITVDEDTLAFDVIKQVGPGGHFVSSKHTRKYMHSEHYHPSLSDRRLREQWEEEGGKDAYQRAKEKVWQILSEHRFNLPLKVRERILSEIPGII
jgi:trimethylamine--corrinoid protein Co-methyltransferase